MTGTGLQVCDPSFQVFLLYLWHSLLSQISYYSLFNSNRTMNKRTINRRPLKVFCDRCWLCFYLSLKSLAGHRPANAVPDALDWWKGPVAGPGVFFCWLWSQLQPGSCTPFWRLPGSFLLPLLPFTSLMALGKLPKL